MTDSTKIKAQVRSKYAEIVLSEKKGEGCGCGCGTSETDQQVYSVFAERYDHQPGYLPDADLSLGCGMPADHANIQEGDVVIDLGSGAGNDCFVARSIVGETGEVIGIDMTPEMIAKAKANAAKVGYNNVKFRLGDIEDLPVTANKADVIISNCVLNLVPDKHAAFNEIIRVLKPGGHFCISDVVTDGDIPEKLIEQAELYAGCVAGAIAQEAYLAIIEQTGFKNTKLLSSKKIELPEALVKNILSPEEYEVFVNEAPGIYSITVAAEKPNCC